MNNQVIFVWTFQGVVEAIIAGLAVIGFAVIALMVAWIKLLEWWDNRKYRKGNRK
jgi:hypothetical protein